MKQRGSWKHYLVELLIVIFGISIAFWLNNIAQEAKENNLEYEYLLDLNEDFKRDSVLINYFISANEKKLESLNSGLKIVVGSKDIAEEENVLGYVFQIGNLSFFDPETFTLRSMLQSGDIKLISSKELRIEMLRLLERYDSIKNQQENILQALDQNHFPKMMESVNTSTGEIVDRSYLQSVMLINAFQFTKGETEYMIQQLQAAAKQVDKLIILTKEELVTHQ